MSDRLLVPHDQPSLHLPPPEAWKQPEKWLDPDRIEKFYAPTDDRRFVIPDATVEQVLGLFRDDYQWPYDKDDPRTRPDDHHFHWTMEAYLAHHHNGSQIPLIFRELKTNRGIMPRQFHNVIHHVTLSPEIPDLSDMGEYIDAYKLAESAFRRLFTTAQLTADALDNQSKRRLQVLANPDQIAGIVDQIGEGFHTRQVGKYFRVYHDLIMQAQILLANNPLAEEAERLSKRVRPHRALEILGSAAVRRQVNYVPLIVGKLAA